MNSLSLAFTCRDTIDDIEKMVASTNGIFDQVVAAWNGDDPTMPGKLRKLGVECYRHEWQNDFSAARNFAFSKCWGDYICYLDVDETLVNPEILRKYIDSEPKANIIAIMLDFYQESIVYWKERVIKRGAYVWRGPVHDVPLAMGKIRPVFLEGVGVKHDWHSQLAHNDEHRLVRNERIIRANLAKCPTPQGVYDLAMTIGRMGPNHYDEARHYLWRTLAVFSRFDVQMSAMRELCGIAIDNSDLATLRLASRKLIDLAPDRPDGYFKRAVLHYLENDWNMAINASEAGFTRDVVQDGQPVQWEEYSLKPATIYAASLEIVGERNKAIHVIGQTLTQYPHDPWLRSAQRRLWGEELMHRFVVDAAKEKETAAAVDATDAAVSSFKKLLGRTARQYKETSRA